MGSLDFFTVIFALQTICLCFIIYLNNKTRKHLDTVISLYNRAKPEREKKVVVPGKGIFSLPKDKKKPKYWTDSELWVKEQDDRYN